MSAFTDFMLAGHNTSVSTLGASALVFGGATYNGIASAVNAENALEDAGYLAMADLQFDIDNTAFAASAIGDRSVVAIDSVSYEVIGIQTCKHSPITHLLLKRDR